MRVVGLDLSLLATGVCILEGEETPTIVTRLISRERSSGVTQRTQHIRSISDEINKIIKEIDCPLVVIEAAAKNQVWQAAAIGELHGVVKDRLLFELNIRPRVEQATKMRKAVVGTINSSRKKVVTDDGSVVKVVDYGRIPGKRDGKTKKATVKDIIEIRLKQQGLEFSSQDEMDAYIAAKFVWDEMIQGKL